MFPKMNMVFLGLVSVLLLSGCGNDLEEIEEIVRIEEDYHSVLSYIDDKGIKLSDEVFRDEDGEIIELEESDKRDWEKVDYISVVRIISGVRLGINSFDVVKENIGDRGTFFIVMNGDLYNSNDKEVAYGILGESKLEIGRKTYSLDERDKMDLRENGINFFDAADRSLKFKEDSVTNVNLYFKIGDYFSESFAKSFDILDTIKIRNLGMDLLIREQIYEEDWDEDEKLYVNMMRDRLLKSLDL